MRERLVEIATCDGSMAAHVFHPDGDGPFPAVLFLMDTAGLREELCDMARRIATVGYYVLVPNLYYRLARIFDFDANRMDDPAYNDKVAEMWRLNRSLSNTMIEQDTAALLAFFDSDPVVHSERVATVGYSMSGRFVLRIAGAFPERIAAAASIYGVKFITDLPDSAHLLADQIRGEMYFAWADHDPLVTDLERHDITSLMQRAGVKSTVELYPNAQHGFAFPLRRVYQKAAAERHWERLFALFRRNLPGPPP